MNVKSKENKENSAIELVIEVDGATFDAAVNKVYNKQKKKINIPGFRKGKAPRQIVEAMFGADVFYEDAIEEVYPEAYSEAIKQEGIKPVAYPKLEIVEAGKNGLTFKALVTVRPEAKLGQYKGITAPKQVEAVTPEDVEREMQTYVQRETRLISVERPAQNGDTVDIDFEGFKDGVPFQGGKGEHYSLELGSGSFIPGFEEQVVGMAVGEEKDLNVTFPEDYSAKDLAGQPAVFKVKLHEVKEHQVPEIDDEFAKDVSEFDTLDEFKADLERQVKERREQNAQRTFEEAVLEKLGDSLEVELPEAMVDYRVDRAVDDYRYRIESQGMRFDQYLSMMGMNLADMKKNFVPGATRQIKVELALEEVAKAEGLEVSDEDVAAEYNKLAKEYRMELDQVKAAVNEEDLKHDVLSDKARKIVFDSAVVGEPEEKPSEPAVEAGPAEAEPAKKPARKRTAKKAESAEGAEGAEGEAAEKKPARKRAAKKAEEPAPEENEGE